MKINLIDALCYLYPHREDIVVSHPSLSGTWKECLKLVKEKDSYFAPLLVDDIVRDGLIKHQSVEDILADTIGESYAQLPWFGHPVMESTIMARYGDWGCKIFDAIYHRDIILSLSLQYEDWKWIAVQPITFQEQQSGMLEDLWTLIYGNVSWGAIASREQSSTDAVRKRARDQFLSHFEHHWIDEKGELHSITHPKYDHRKIIHA